MVDMEHHSNIGINIIQTHQVHIKQNKIFSIKGLPTLRQKPYTYFHTTLDTIYR